MFDFVILEDDGFCYLLTRDDQLACLGRIRSHLAAAGCFFLALPTPQEDLANPQPHEYNPIRQILTVQCEWISLDERGNRRMMRQGIERRRLTYPCELDLLLKTAGFEMMHRWGDYRRAAFSDPSKHDYLYLMREA